MKYWILWHWNIDPLEPKFVSVHSNEGEALQALDQAHENEARRINERRLRAFATGGSFGDQVDAAWVRLNRRFILSEVQG